MKFITAIETKSFTDIRCTLISRRSKEFLSLYGTWQKTYNIIYIDKFFDIDPRRSLELEKNHKSVA